MVKARKINQIAAVVRFFLMSDDSKSKLPESKIRPLWKALIEGLSDLISQPEYGRIIAQLANWLPLIKEIDAEALSWLKLSAKSMSAEPANSFLFIPHLSKRTKDSPSQVAQILLEMLYADVYPDFKQEAIVGIVRDLYSLGQKENSDRICNMYGTKGFDFLEDIYREHNKPVMAPRKA
jgi:hypothetical protein